MINGTVKGKIVSRKRFEANESADYCAQIVVEVEKWVDGEVMKQNMVVYCPAFMAKRIDFWMKEETKFIVVSFNYMSVIDSASNPSNHYISLRAQELS